MIKIKMKEHQANRIEQEANPINGNEDSKKKNVWMVIVNNLQNLLNFVTVEPYLLCYVLPYVISAPAVQKLNLVKACRSDLNFNDDVCARMVTGDVTNNITSEASTKAQRLVADMTAWKQPLQSGIPALLILFVGAWSDRTGNRKALMIMPLLGEMISSFGLLLATYFFLEWPLWVTALIESLPPAFFGGFSIAIMGAYSFLADVTTTESRTFRVGLVTVIMTLGVPLGSSISGILTKAVGFYGIFGINLVIYAIGCVHTMIHIHDVRKVEVKETFCVKVIQFFHPKNVLETVSLVMLARGRQFVQILLVICVHIVVIGPVYGETVVLALYTLKKFNMDVLVEFSLFSTYSTIMGLTGTTIAVTIFSKWLKMHDALLGIIATVCKVISSFVYALAPTRAWFYSGPAFDFFGNSGVTAIRSLGTKIVGPDEVGKMNSLIGLVEAVAPIVYIPIYSKLYSNTIETLPGAFYLLGGIMTIPAFFIFIVLYIIHKKQQTDVVNNPVVKEIHAHDNCITAL